MKEFKVEAFPRRKIYKRFDFFAKPDFRLLEEYLEEESAEGWDIISVSSNQCVSCLAGNIIVTMSREKK